MRSKALQSKVDRLILDQASEWFVDFRVSDVDATARERFDEWLRRSPEHIRAYMEIAKTYVQLPELNLAAKADVDALIAHAHAAENVVPFENTGLSRPHESQVAGTKTDHSMAPMRKAGDWTPRRRRFLIAAACVFAVMIAGVAWWQSDRYPTYVTDIGERRSLTLADGSTVDLNARSQVRIEFSVAERRVELLDGQALFQVAKDKDRPFIVRSGDATVRAVGTQFDVYRKGGGTTVTVLEGRVAVYSTRHWESPAAESAASMSQARPIPGSPQAAPAQAATHATPLFPAGLADPSGSAALFLSSGEQVIVTSAQSLPAPTRADIAATTSWMQRRLIFDGSKLADVVQEFNRYNRRQLVIDSTRFSDFHISGVYSSTDPASLIRFLREQPDMKITEGDNEVRIAEK